MLYYILNCHIPFINYEIIIIVWNSLLILLSIPKNHEANTANFMLSKSVRILNQNLFCNKENKEIKANLLKLKICLPFKTASHQNLIRKTNVTFFFFFLSFWWTMLENKRYFFNGQFYLWRWSESAYFYLSSKPRHCWLWFCKQR